VGGDSSLESTSGAAAAFSAIMALEARARGRLAPFKKFFFIKFGIQLMSYNVALF
jgi:hypothetical protein